MSTAHAHVTAEFVDVPAQQLADTALLGGLLIAAASAAGLSSTHPPVVYKHPEGVSAALLLDGAHIIAHSYPNRRVLLFDILAPASHDFRNALDVFARRLTAREVHSDTRTRG